MSRLSKLNKWFPNWLKPSTSTPIERKPVKLNLQNLESREVPAVVISGTVLNDLNGNGILNAGEGGVSGATVTIRQDSINGSVVGTAQTDMNGAWSVSGLTNNKTFFVTVAGPAGFMSTNAIPETNSNDGTTATREGTNQIKVVAGANSTSQGNQFLIKNDAPTISSISDRTTTEDTATTISFTVADAETAVGSLSLSVTSSNPTLTSSGSFSFGGSGANRTLTITPTADRHGTADITVTVTDAGGRSASTQFKLTVISVNDAPDGADKSVTTPRDTAYTFTVADFGFSDPKDSPANSLLAVKITTLPANGSLRLIGSGGGDGNAVNAGEFIAAADIAAGRLRFSPASGVTGSTSFTFQVQDNGGTANGGVDLDSTPNTITISMTGPTDSVPPTTTASASPVANSAGWNNGNVTVTLTATDNTGGTGVKATYYTVNGGPQQTYTAPFTLSTDGTNSVVFWSVDNSNNVESYTGTAAAAHTLTVKIDKTAPVVSMTGPAASSFTNNNQPILTATASDAGSGVTGVQFQIKGVSDTDWTNVGSPATGTSPYSVQVSNLLADGTYQVRVIATDAAGNSTTSAAINFTIDVTKPVVADLKDMPDPFSPNGDAVFDETTISYTLSEDATVSVTIHDGATLVRTLVGSEQQAAGSRSVIWTGANDANQIVADGTYTYKVIATDAAGNISYEQQDTVTVDNTAPVVEFVSKPVDPTNSRSASFTFGGSDNYTAASALTFVYSLNDSGWWALPGNTLDLSNLADGRYTLSVRSIDEAGNVSAAKIHEWTVDGTAPTSAAVVTGETKNESGWFTGPATVTLSSSDAQGELAVSGVAATYYRIGTGPETKYTGAFELASNGEHTVSYWCVDNAGNTEQAQTVTVKIDQTAPTTTAQRSVVANQNGWNNTNVTITFSPEDGHSGLAKTYYQVGNGPVQEGTSVALAEGIHTVKYWSVDVAGNVEVAQTLDVNIDKTAPTLTGELSSAAAATGWYNVSTGALTITFSASDALSGGVTAPAAYTLSDGVNQSYTVSVTDLAGNTATYSISGINQDTVAPTVVASRTGVDYAAAYDGWNNTAVTVSFMADDGDGSGVTTPADIVYDADGEYVSPALTVTDLAGNTSTSAAVNTFTIKIDTTAPTVMDFLRGTLSDATYNGWYNLATGAAVYSYQADDAGSGLASLSEDAYTFSDGVGMTKSFTITDVAGNSVTVTSALVKQDTVAPVLTASVNAPASTGWYNRSTGAATVTYMATDDGGSGVTSPASHVFGDGTGLSVTAITVTDEAGNTSISAGGVSEIHQDLVAPAVTNTAGGSTADTGSFSIGGSDNAGGSGLAALEYRITGTKSDGSAFDSGWQDGSSGVANFSALGLGSQTLTVRATDVAGNVTTESKSWSVAAVVAPSGSLTVAAGTTVTVGANGNITVSASATNDVGTTSANIVYTSGPSSSVSVAGGNLVIQGANGGTSFSIGSTSVASGGVTVNFSGNTSVTLNAGNGNDTFLIAPGTNVPNLVINGGGGVNTLDFSAWSAGVYVNLSSGVAATYAATNGVFSSLQATIVSLAVGTIQNVTGGAGNDILIGDARANHLTGGAGNDVLIGMDGNDRLVGGSGNDILVSGKLAQGVGFETAVAMLQAAFVDLTVSADEGSDAGKSFDDGDGNDTLTGGAGRDWFIISLGDTITDVNSKNNDFAKWLTSNLADGATRGFGDDWVTVVK